MKRTQRSSNSFSARNKFCFSLEIRCELLGRLSRRINSMADTRTTNKTAKSSNLFDQNESKFFSFCRSGLVFYSINLLIEFETFSISLSHTAWAVPLEKWHADNVLHLNSVSVEICILHFVVFEITETMLTSTRRKPKK